MASHTALKWINDKGAAKGERCGQVRLLARSGRLRGDDCVADPPRCELFGTETAVLVVVVYPVASAPTSALYLAVRGPNGKEKRLCLATVAKISTTTRSTQYTGALAHFIYSSNWEWAVFCVWATLLLVMRARMKCALNYDHLTPMPAKDFIAVSQTYYYKLTLPSD